MIGLIKKYWHDPVWSNVLATAIGALVTICFAYLLNWWPAIKSSSISMLNFLMAKLEVANWLIGVLAAPWLIVPIAAGWFIATGRRNFSAPNWKNYKSDIFFGIKWSWEYDGTGQLHEQNVYSLCPYCDYQIDPKPNTSWSLEKTDYQCDNCNCDLGKHQDTESQLKDKVIRQIQRKLRRGEWQTSP